MFIDNIKKDIGLKYSINSIVRFELINTLLREKTAHKGIILGFWKRTGFREEKGYIVKALQNNNKYHFRENNVKLVKNNIKRI